jgi:nitrogen regulatory protein P-II 1
MKKIEAYIRPEKLTDIKETLNRLNINGLTVSEVMGAGNQKGWMEYVRGTAVEYNFLPKVKLEIVVPDEQADELVDTLCREAYTGEVGDGKIFIYDVLDAVRIRTRERGTDAVR